MWESIQQTANPTLTRGSTRYTKAKLWTTLGNEGYLMISKRCLRSNVERLPAASYEEILWVNKIRHSPRAQLTCRRLRLELRHITWTQCPTSLQFLRFPCGWNFREKHITNYTWFPTNTQLKTPSSNPLFRGELGHGIHSNARSLPHFSMIGSLSG